MMAGPWPDRPAFEAWWLANVRAFNLLAVRDPEEWKEWRRQSRRFNARTRGRPMCKLLDFINEKLFGAKPKLPVVGPRTIADPLAYIVQARADGSLMTVHDTLTERRHDWPLPVGWEASESVLMDDGKVYQSFDFLRAEHDPGDGGQILEVGADGFIRGIATRDGGTPYMQYFVGRANSGTGWIFFGIDAPTGRWRELVATLAKSNWSDAKPPLSKAFTRYRLEMIAFPFAIKGTRASVRLPAVISEHYDGETVANSQAMERSYFAYGYGLVRWEAWTRNHVDAATAEALHSRYHHVDYSEQPAPGWFLADVRTYTNVVACEPRPIQLMS